MRILVLSVFPAPYRVEVLRGLSKKYELTIFFERNRDGERNKDWFKNCDDFSYYILENKNDKKRYCTLKKRIYEFDLVICYDPFTFQALKLEIDCIIHRIPFVINADGVLNIDKKFPKKQIKGYIAKRSSLCFAGSESAVRYFLSYGARKEKIVKHNFTSFYSFEIQKKPLNDEEKTDIRQQYNLPKGKLVITVGQFIYRKGFDILLEAWNNVNVPDAQLLIIGGGGMREQYEKYISDNNLKNVFIENYIAHNDLMRIYCVSDLFVIPTREDIWGLVVNEAMACALPVVSSNHCIAGMELIKENVCGHIYKYDDPMELSFSINDILKDDIKRKHMSEQALESIMAYTYENICMSHIIAIDKLAREQGI